MVSGQEPDTLYSLAQEAVAERDYDGAYRLYEQAGASFEQAIAWQKYLRCRIEMARASQFTSIVSREAIKEIIDPAIARIEKDSSLHNYREAAECYQFLARYHWAIRGDYDTAIDEYQVALDICEHIGDSANQEKMASLADLSHVYSNREEFDQALDCAAKALGLSKAIYGDDHMENGPRYYNLGFTYYRKGHYDRAIAEISKGIEILQKNQGPELQIGLGYNNLSAVYVAQLDQEGALKNSQAAAEIFSKYLGPDHEAIGTIEWDLGVMYLDLKNYDSALLRLLRAKEIFEKNFGPAFPQLPQLYHQLGQCYDEKNQYLEGEKWHQKALQINLAQYGREHVRSGESFRNLAQHYIAANQLVEAEEAISAALLIIRNPANQSALLKAWVYEQKASLLSQKEQYLASAAAYDSACIAVSTPGTNTANLAAARTFNPLFFAEYQSSKSAVFFSLYKKVGDTDYLIQALTAARLAHEGIRTLRLSYQSATSKLFLQERARSHYEMMVDQLYEAWHSSGDDTYLGEAWKISEETKSLLLLEEIKSSSVVFHNIPTAITDTLGMLKQDLSYYEQAVFQQEEIDASMVSQYQTAYLTTANKLQQFQQHIKEQYPDSRSIFEDMQTASLEEVVAALEPENVILEYFVSDSMIYSFGLVNEHVIWSRNKKENFEDALQSFIAESRDLTKIINNPAQAIADHHRQSSYLFDYLFSSALLEAIKSIKKIIIIPDQNLNYLSFEALSSSENSADYLIEKHAITYAYSASLWYLQNRVSAKVALDNFGGFAPSYNTVDTSTSNDLALLSRAGLSDLPGAKQEVLAIKNQISGDIWVDDQATESFFKDVASTYNILHLALHGLLDQEEPMKSRLLFHPTSAESGELNAYEIYNLPLRANLAVLSACNTGTGRLRSGEGILSLSRAFAFAGVPNLIASLWRADDAASSQIMIKFYEGLASNLTKDEALQRAKLSYLHSQKTDTYRHPYFWSSYILVGENSQHFTQPRPWYWWVLGFLALGLILYAALKNKNFQKK